MTLKRACTLMTVKSVNEDERIITGIASTPSPDRDGDIMEPEGRNSAAIRRSSGSTTALSLLAPARQNGERGVADHSKARETNPDMPSQLIARLDEAWASIKAGLVRGLSIGFRPIEYSFRMKAVFAFVPGPA